MFDSRFSDTSDAGLIAAIAEHAAAEAAAAAGRLAAVAELVHRRCGDDQRAHWACDEWDSAAAEISAALGVGHRRASGQMYLSMALRLRLPKVAALFLDGKLSARVISAIAWRTELVEDADARALIDASIAEHAGRWDALSQYKLDQSVDFWVDRHDPGSLRRTRASAQNRDVSIGGQDPEAGTTSLWGRLLATDATILQRRLAEMAREVCDDDPRSMGERRADALGTLAAGGQHLSCQCGGPECPASGPDPRATSVVIHVLADAEAAAGQPDSAAVPGTAVIAGGSIIPTPLLSELIRSGARVRPVRRPPSTAELRYRPSTALDEFVRMRDLTCRFPSCDRPAEKCDLDHAIPWPFGPTQASNIRALCRKHHLMKTFWTGTGGWSDRQYPDGTIVWTSPTCATYTTRPGSRLLFPAWNSTTAELSITAGPPESGNDLMMPARRRTRAADRAYRHAVERSLNDARVAERNKPPPF
ncbi:HNH endonuclease signature motif containing protein [Mycolicibacterium sp.]|uniref:HNH endonuclease signature motif containing protein n=1 Tax=Mycolicibacterium sp. TaxID=2320850 RepID=UPI001DBFF0A8|nr:HNH endonuclease signature motif containing protein [Mycolicibacterium sp.]MCB1290221.1 DUF222 domain-containing protein [Mycobacterium sp.]MCB9411028.1 DUF222 domain-containing protein [Mycolicibacterium sp.]